MTARLLVICGPTASGKSDLALSLAARFDAEIVNADSMQLYRGMDIGTAKVTPEQRREIRHHLIDIADPDENVSAARYAEEADRAIAEILSRGKRVIVVGGTGLYIRALLKGLVDSPSGSGEVRSRLQQEARERGNQAMLDELMEVDPESAGRMHPNNLVRIIRALEVYRITGIPLSRYQQEHGFSSPRYQALQIGLEVERSELYRRIEQRVDGMLAAGLVDEVRRLLQAGYSRQDKALRGIGYKEIISFLDGECTCAEAVELIKRDTRRYAKRQMTWFRAENEIIWLEHPEKFDTITHYADELWGDKEA